MGHHIFPPPMFMPPFMHIPPPPPYTVSTSNVLPERKLDEKPNKAWSRSLVKHNIENIEGNLAALHGVVSSLRAMLSSSDESALENAKTEIIQAGDLQKQTEELLNALDNEEVIAHFRRKVYKIHKHKVWRNRKRKTQELHTLQVQALIDKKHKECDEWLARMKAAQIAKAKEERLKKEEDARALERANSRQAEKQLAMVARRLQELRQIRKEKQKRLGYMFPEDDDLFFQKVLSELERNEREKTKAEEQAKKEAALRIEKETKEERERALLRADEPQDEFYQFFTRSSRDIHELIAVRRTWDQFLVPPGTGGTRIPLEFVSPPPNPSTLWAPYLRKKAH
eukprot:CAMPEP_0184643764 /NCGR_PEP_ID=MMETSP0308-20130426/592_1 /TAXON_ID=38269 /ORGANISM="Gloeochaete witrockiana, Strain SAG 46.84" /LENGTH=339 /DNA_ID=CAMNT_0027071921 /DNA_START=201 /DNA_END=1220 /DNA_ORIENTATION=+